MANGRFQGQWDALYIKVMEAAQSVAEAAGDVRYSEHPDRDQIFQDLKDVMYSLNRIGNRLKAA